MIKMLLMMPIEIWLYYCNKRVKMLFLMVMWVVMSLLMIPEINDNYKW